MAGVMDYFFKVDWRQVFMPTMAFSEAFVRMTAVYLSLVFLLRFVLRREVGALGVSDILVLVLVADAAQNAMAGTYVSVTDGLILVAILVFWDWALNYIGFKWRPARRALEPAPLLLVRNGQPMAENLRKQLMTDEELMHEMRLKGIANLDEVEYAFLEPDGEVSVVKKGAKDGDARNKRRDTF